MTARRASLAMYSLGGVRPAYRRLWDAVVREVPELPKTLTWPDDVHATWTDDDMVVKQTCGWPLVTRLGPSVRVVGAFEPELSDAVDHRYRSVIVSTRPGSPEDFATAHLAFNSGDSLSGWVSLVVWSGRSADSLLAGATESGSHVSSLRLLQEREVELASIDAVTFAHVQRHWPILLTGVEVVGRGPLVPSLPVVVPASEADLVERLRDAFATVVGSSALATTCHDLLIGGFVPLDLDDYRTDLSAFAQLVGD